MHRYRTHNCNELNIKNKNQKTILSGWVNKKRDHGNLLFIDLRDNYGLTQCVIDKSNTFFKDLEKLQLESVIKIEGMILARTKDTINSELKTGEIEVKIGVWNSRKPSLIISDLINSITLDLKIIFS